MKRVEWIDVVRGLAMVMIVVGHSLYGYTFSAFARTLFAVHVPVFFVLSGYLFTQKKWKVLFHKGKLNLLLPYMATCLLIIILSWIGFHFPRQRLLGTMGLTRNTILASFYGLGTPVHLSLFGGIQIPAIGVIWFLVAMYCGNMLFNASLKIGTYFNKQVVIVLVLSLLESILGFVIARRLALPWSFNAALVSQIFYCGGYLIRYLKLMENKNPVYFLGGLILWGVSVHSGFFYLNTAFANAPVLAILGALGGSFALMKLAQAMISFNWKLSLLRNYGQLSLIVMCFHLIDITLLYISGFIYNELTMIHVTPILVVCAVICYRLLFTILAVLIIPHIPLLRSFYLNRRFPVVNPKLGIISKRLF